MWSETWTPQIIRQEKLEHTRHTSLQGEPQQARTKEKQIGKLNYNCMQDRTAKQGGHVAQLESKLQNYIHCNEIKSTLVLEDLCQPRDPITTTEPPLPSKEISLEPIASLPMVSFCSGDEYLGSET